MDGYSSNWDKKKSKMAASKMAAIHGTLWKVMDKAMPRGGHMGQWVGDLRNLKKTQDGGLQDGRYTRALRAKWSK